MDVMFWESDIGQNAVKYWHSPEPELITELLKDQSKPEYWYSFHNGYSRSLIQTYPLVFVALAFSYVPCLLLGKWIMKDRPPLELKTPLLIWNMLCSILSGLGAIPFTLYIIQDLNRLFGDFEAHLCDVRPYSTWVGFATDLFVLSKLFEWTDTVFLILRKKPIIFLHWFHHLMTAVYCWLSCIYVHMSDSAGIWFGGMNMWVHFIMYGYYAMTTLGFRFKLSFLITFLQTLQMFIGLYFVLQTPRCPDAWSKIGVYYYLGLFMYAVYLLLFAKLLVQKFLLSGVGKSKRNKVNDSSHSSVKED